MNKIKLMTILSLTLTLGLLLSGCAVMDLDYETIDIDDEKTIELGNISQLTINSVSSDITILFENRDDILATYKGSVRTAKKDYYPELTVSESSRKIGIWIDYPKNSLYLNDIDTKLTIYLPESYSADLSIGSVSGDININEATLELLDCDSVSGEIIADGINAERGKFKTVSGDITMNQFASTNVDASTVSGDISLEIPKSYDLDLTTNTVSGDVSNKDGHSTEITEDIDVDANTVSGDITIMRY
ncbi:MAG: DUF4097 family beta strand repeat-containing protein [Vallitaleaceae bacterium]|jgi:hypothetical protein|nr:DUF4097 family beta strand repeat-containing protein [Vallitaleaceae bacterium]